MTNQTIYSVAYFNDNAITYIHAKTRQGMLSNARKLIARGIEVDQMFSTTRTANGNLIATRAF